MMKGKAVQLVLNEVESGHGDVIERLMLEADHLICMVAFAKKSAYKLIKDLLTDALKKGLTAKMAIGLDFHITEPSVLAELLKLTRKYELELYLSNSDSAFHPKIYAFQRGSEYSVLVGSANLTHGGFYGNYEASTLIADQDGEMTKSIRQHFDEMVADNELIPATKKRIDEYSAEFVIHDGYRRVAKRRAQNLAQAPQDLALLRHILELMKQDRTDQCFESQQLLRDRNRKDARRMLRNPVQFRGLDRRAFQTQYESLIALFHSGGLHRHKNRISDASGRFVAAVDDIIAHPELPAEDAFELLRDHFRLITGAGINLLTEILHALDNKRFPVMNQNAIFGMRMAGILDYPLQPFKTNVNGLTYARYCQHAGHVRDALALANFTELDALFNYLYWRDLPEESNDD
ncbi:phospholipase D-like domain-containing protein [Pseudomonas sp. GM80]|uniref:phospholipase D-like domain-containing protein n=1 Tax=Pseudomonas sp. GM80 TaxID=1144339 RepID=UPI00026FC83D|nr:phospholipase D-like domain-containing protein [Pseudomonas sp. GM80]EJN34343.1 putative HKD family nuclease [Pseudomonas sp. GM80]